MSKNRPKRKGFRDGISKEDIVSLTDEEKQRIRDMRQYMDAPAGSLSRDVFLYSDQVRRMIRERKNTVEKRLWNIEDIENQMKRLQDQLDKDNITEELKNGVKMTAAEVRTQMKHMQWIRDGEAENIPYLLAEIRSFASHKDVAGNVIMTVEQFDEYANSILYRLRGYGYEIFSQD